MDAVQFFKDLALDGWRTDDIQLPIAQELCVLA